MAKITELTLHRPRKPTLKLKIPAIMGILNVTPDSFSDGGSFSSKQKAIDRAKMLIEEGADILDIGGESSRPGAKPVPVEEELKRVIPVIEGIRQFSQIPISIDTYKAKTAQTALDAGADFINDISALRFDSEMAEVAAESGVTLIMMHMQGTPRDMQKNPIYENVNAEIIAFFEKQLAYAEMCGVKRERVILDPGIGFGKRLVDNLAILSHISVYAALGLPVLLGTSRKSFIEQITGQKRQPQARIGGSLASLLSVCEEDVAVYRVHDVADTIEALKVYNAVRGN